MARYVALLRAINVGGTRRLPMAELRGLFEALGFEPVQTLLQTGNVIFGGARGAEAAIERRLTAAAKSQLGLETDFFVRSGAAWAEIVRDNPFPREAKKEPAKLAVLTLSKAPAPRAAAELEAQTPGPERIRTVGREAYVYYPDGMGRSKLTLARIERGLGARGTARNWNTVMKIAALLEES